MDIGELECFDHSDRLFDRSSDWEIMDVGGAKGALGVDEEGSAERDAFLGDEDVVGFRGGVVLVRELGARAIASARRM